MRFATSKVGMTQFWRSSNWGCMMCDAFTARGTRNLSWTLASASRLESSWLGRNPNAMHAHHDRDSVAMTAGKELSRCTILYHFTPVCHPRLRAALHDFVENFSPSLLSITRNKSGYESWRNLLLSCTRFYSASAWTWMLKSSLYNDRFVLLCL